MRVKDFHPASDVPDLTGKVALVTGGTAGIGKELLCLLAAHNPAHLVFTGRNATTAEEVTSQVRAINGSIKVTFLKCDLGKLSTVKATAESFLAMEPNRLDLFIANAGVMAVPPATSPDGHEVQFAPMLGHAALIRLLLPSLRTTAKTHGDARVLMATSVGYRLHPLCGIDFNTLRTDAAGLNTWVRYGQAKLAAMLYARELARREPELLSVSVHPGVARTGLVNNLSFFNKAVVYVFNMGIFIEPDEAAFNLLYLSTATEKEKLTNGAYYEPVGVKTKTDKQAENDKLAGELWDWMDAEMKTLGIEYGVLTKRR